MPLLCRGGLGRRPRVSGEVARRDGCGSLVERASGLGGDGRRPTAAAVEKRADFAGSRDVPDETGVVCFENDLGRDATREVGPSEGSLGSKKTCDDRRESRGGEHYVKKVILKIVIYTKQKRVGTNECGEILA